MTRTIAAALMLAGLGGCALVPFRHHARPADRPAAPAQAVASTEGGLCKVDQLKVLIGRPGSAVLAAQAIELSGAKSIRWMHPGEMVTMDFRADRLNIKLTHDNIVKSFACG